MSNDSPFTINVGLLKNDNLELDFSCVEMTNFIVGFCHADEGGICLSKRH